MCHTFSFSFIIIITINDDDDDDNDGNIIIKSLLSYINTAQNRTLDVCCAGPDAGYAE